MKEHESFSRKVYALTAQIPAGKVATYGQIAALLGNPRAARAVGTAMANTPFYLDIPCHRVVKASGDMAPGYAFGGAEKQRAMLGAEGVLFREDGTVDMKKCLWRKDT